MDEFLVRLPVAEGSIIGGEALHGGFVEKPLLLSLLLACFPRMGKVVEDVVLIGTVVIFRAVIHLEILGGGRIGLAILLLLLNLIKALVEGGEWILDFMPLNIEVEILNNLTLGSLLGGLGLGEADRAFAKELIGRAKVGGYNLFLGLNFAGNAGNILSTCVNDEHEPAVGVGASREEG